MRSLVFMGVSGCGKSSAAAGVAARLSWTLIEGDDFHPAANLQKMQSGQALNDEDRAGWLLKLQTMLGQYPEGVVMTCSALKRRYRDQLRLGARDLGFVFMDLSPELARQRVLARGETHFMPATLIDSQFADLESPVGENGVLRVDATLALHDIVDAVVQWIESQ